MDDQLKQSALDFHEFPVPGKIRYPRPNRWRPSAIWRWPTRRVAAPCPEIEKIRWQRTNTPPVATGGRYL